MLSKIIPTKDFYIWIGIAFVVTAALAVVVGQQSVIIYNDIGYTEQNIGQFNVDLLRGKDVILEWFRRNN